MQNNRLDKFIKNKLENKSFEYNPADWENALKLIEKNDKKERPLWIWWGAACIVMMGLLYFGWNLSHQSENPVISELTVSSEENQPDLEGNKENISKDLLSNNSSEIEISNLREIENPDENLKTRVTHTVDNVLQQEVVPRTTAQVIDFTKLPDPISGNHPNPKPKSSPEPESDREGRSGEEFLVLDKSIRSAIDDKKVSESEKLERSIMFVSDFEPINSRINLIRYFSTAKLPKVYPVEEPIVKLGFGWGLSSYANLQVKDFQSGKKITGFSVGANSTYRFSKMLSVNADLQYIYRTGTFEKSNASTRRRFKFDAQEVAATLNPTALHYASMPVYIGVHFNRHKILFGGSLNYLAAVRGGLNDKVIDGMGNVIDEIDLEGWIAKDGFTILNPGALMGYDYYLSNRWSVNFRSNYLFNSIIDKEKSIEINSPILKENSQLNLQIGTTFYFK